MKDTPTLPDTKPSALDYIKQSALEYIINYLFDGLETCDTMVDLLLCHMLANLTPCPHADRMAPQDS
jgi:hypothetical protein